MIAPIFYVLCAFVQTYKNYYGETILFPWLIDVGQFSIGILQFISFIFLAIGLFQIKKFIKNSMFRDHINDRIVFIHLLCFTLYLIGGLASYLIVSLISAITDENKQVVLFFLIISVVLDFAAEVFLARIFLELGKTS